MIAALTLAIALITSADASAPDLGPPAADGRGRAAAADTTAPVLGSPAEDGRGETDYDPVLSQLDVQSDVAPRTAKLGEEIVWSTGVTFPEGGSVGFADPFTGGPLTLKSREIRSLGDGKAVAKLVLTGLSLGDFTLPPLRLRFTGADGADHPFSVLGGKITIAPIDEKKLEQHGIVPPVAVYDWNYWFFGALAAVIAGAAGLRWWMKRPRKAPPPPPPPVDRRTPAQRALDEIFKLQTSGMLERREVKAFTYALDDIVRRFLIESFHTGDLTETTEEFLTELRPRLTEQQRLRVQGFFDQSDRVRFAGEEHEIDEAKALCEQAIALTNIASGGEPA